MAYVQEAQAAEGREQGAEGEGQPAEEPEKPSAEDAERAKARSKIWTPPGS